MLKKALFTHEIRIAPVLRNEVYKEIWGLWGASLAVKVEQLCWGGRGENGDDLTMLPVRSPSPCVEISSPSVH